MLVKMIFAFNVVGKENIPTPHGTITPELLRIVIITIVIIIVTSPPINGIFFLLTSQKHTIGLVQRLTIILSTSSFN